MTPARKAALQWFHDRGEVGWFDASAPSPQMRTRLEAAGMLEPVKPKAGVGLIKYRLTDAGRQALHEAGQ